MHALALQFLLLQPVVEGNMGSIRNELFVKAVHALSVGPMLAEQFRLSLFVF
jgi:hypothetical protein